MKSIVDYLYGYNYTGEHEENNEEGSVDSEES